ncbi:heterokaryon incompatibility protein-domain-containing protein [Podospora appendiculata]|uniref:Heterokaryon incompatibility protein-domain-containing protein n=1 Tax=Podospora appendiculata TaxID=314037 RepID=A0AAE0XDC8_9PEZI|nr:heterokaryon incompatibility protein-domain-containing protein [Podospora appendiculata]
MRLINTTDFSLREVYEPGPDYQYAILSHTWDESLDDPRHREVTFQDIQAPERTRLLTGWAKIEKTCELARAYDPPLRWAWIDTCCIDKSSSAELTEAINSMFRWYQQSTVCFALLSDMPPASPMSPRPGKAPSVSDQFHAALSGCRWFTRGWTLQELLAPKTLYFYDSAWIRRGAKGSMMSEISRITRIDEQVLTDQRFMFQVPLGRRMSWASGRSTKRVEDMAYCLLGIFNINIPLIYGEGDKAFARLQEALVRQSVDLSLFAWDAPGTDTTTYQAFHGMFATSPKQFANCHGLVAIQDAVYAENQSLMMTNRGLELLTYLRSDILSADRYVVHLNCFMTDAEGSSAKQRSLGVRVVRTYNGFARCHPDGLCFIDGMRMKNRSGFRRGDATPEKVYIPASLTTLESAIIETRFKDSIRFRISQPPRASVVLNCTLGLPSGSDRRAWEKDKPVLYTWDQRTQTFLTNGEELFIGLLHADIRSDVSKNIHWPLSLGILCGFRKEGHVDVAKRVSVTSEERRPWAYVIAIASEKDACIKVDGTPFRRRDITLLVHDLDLLIDSGASYGSALASMRERLLGEDYYYTDAEDYYSPCPTTIRLTPYQLGPPDAAGNPQRQLLEQATLALTLSLKNVRGELFDSYEATLHFDPAAYSDSPSVEAPGPESTAVTD